MMSLISGFSRKDYLEKEEIEKTLKVLRTKLLKLLPRLYRDIKVAGYKKLRTDKWVKQSESTYKLALKRTKKCRLEDLPFIRSQLFILKSSLSSLDFAEKDVSLIDNAVVHINKIHSIFRHNL